MRVLIIEDDLSCIQLMESLIELAGHEPVNPGQTLSTEQALGFIRAHNPDWILLDMNYGRVRFGTDADGYGVVEGLTEDERCRVICASGTPEEYIGLLRPLGIQHFGGKRGFVACLKGSCRCMGG